MDGLGRLAWLTALLFSSSLVSPVRANEEFVILSERDPTTNYFVNPKPAGPNFEYQDDVVYQVGTMVNLTWVTNYPSVDITLLQPAQGGGADGQLPLKVDVTDQWFLWSVDDPSIVTYHQPVGSVYQFQITQHGALPPGFTSHYFNVTKSSSGSSATTAVSTGATPSSTSKGNDTSNTSSTSNPSTTDKSSASTVGGNSMSIVGYAIMAAVLGVGAGVGAIAAWFCFTRRRRRQARRDAQTTRKLSSSETNGSAVDLEVRPPVEVDATEKIGEVEGDSRTAAWELPINETPIELPTWEDKETKPRVNVSELAHDPEAGPISPETPGSSGLTTRPGNNDSEALKDPFRDRPSPMQSSSQERFDDVRGPSPVFRPRPRSRSRSKDTIPRPPPAQPNPPPPRRPSRSLRRLEDEEQAGCRSPSPLPADRRERRPEQQQQQQRRRGPNWPLS